LAIVGDVYAAHHVIVVAEHGDRAGLGAARNVDELAQHVVIAHPQVADIFLAKLLIHRVRAELGAGVEMIALAERRVALHDRERVQPVVGPDLDFVFDDAIRADHRGRVNARPGMDDCCSGDVGPRRDRFHARQADSNANRRFSLKKPRNDAPASGRWQAKACPTRLLQS
jgi:hypothetical protein